MGKSTARKGWIKLYRRLLDEAIWQNSTPEQKVVLITLLLMANHSEKEWEWEGRSYICKPGQMITSLNSILKQCGKKMSIQKIRTALNRFEKMGFLTNESTNTQRRITICNWDVYQLDESEVNKEDNRHLTNTQQRGNKRLTANKNEKNVKEGKKKKKFAPPPVFEVSAYAQEIGYNLDPEAFVNSYEQKGWMVGKNKMKSWKAAVRNWKAHKWGEKTETNKERLARETIEYEAKEKARLANG